MVIVAVLSIVYSLALNLSAMVIGLVYLVLGVCILMLFQYVLDLCGAHIWICRSHFSGMFAEVVSLGLEELTGKKLKFIFS